MNAVSFSSVRVITDPQVYETAYRRQMQHIHQILQKTRSFDDELTKAIRISFDKFYGLMNNREIDHQSVLEAYTVILQEMLIDPITHTMLDEDSVLGNDGHTYGFKPLSVYLSYTNLEYQSKSPLHPQRGEPFLTVPHPLIQELIKWLKARGAYHPSEEIKSKYDHLKTIRQLAIVPTKENAELRRLKLIKLKREMASSARLQVLLEKQHEIQQAALKGLISPLEDRQNAFEESNWKELKSLKERVSSAQESQDQKIIRLREIERTLREESVNLKQGTGNLKQRFNAVDGANKEIQRAINETRAAISEQKANWLGAVIGVIALTGIGIGCSMLMQGALTAAGSTVKAAMLPLNNGVLARLSIAL